MVEQLLQTTTVCEWLKTVVLHPHRQTQALVATLLQDVLGDAHYA